MAGCPAALATTSASGPAFVWGSNNAGQLGDGTTIDRHKPEPSPALTNVVALAGGFEHMLALEPDGTVWAVGQNGSGQLGNGNTNSNLTPVLVQGVQPATAIAAGLDHSVALRVDGTVFDWGDNSNGELTVVIAATRAPQVRLRERIRLRRIADRSTRAEICCVTRLR